MFPEACSGAVLTEIIIFDTIIPKLLYYATGVGRDFNKGFPIDLTKIAVYGNIFYIGNKVF